MVSLSVILNISRFLFMCLSLAYLHNLPSFIPISILSTILYSLLTPLLPHSHFGVILHKSISHVPSTILLIVVTNSETLFRPHLLILATIQYLGIWLEMYSEVFTLELKAEINRVQRPSFINELLWAGHDSFLVLHLCQLSRLFFNPVAYQVLFVFFISRNALNLINLLRSVMKIVDLEPKKKTS